MCSSVVFFRTRSQSPACRLKVGIPRRRHRHRHGHPRDDPREDVGEDVGVRVRVGVVKCQLNCCIGLTSTIGVQKSEINYFLNI